jgi:tRNA threonylcarbamoyl adenosine modification protein (Sua5/YciO/YrdC/YwlC family)
MSQRAAILEVDPVRPTPRQIEQAVTLLLRDEVIAYPTDTYYGFGCALNSKKAIDKLYQLKQRDRKKPLAFLCPDLSDVAKYAKVSNFAYRIMKQLTPGPFTFILEATKAVPEIMHTKQRQVGIRVPAVPLIQQLCERLECPLVTTSATDFEGNALLDAREIKAHASAHLALILDGGAKHIEPSTVVSLIGDTLEVLRQGKGQLSTK